MSDIVDDDEVSCNSCGGSFIHDDVMMLSDNNYLCMDCVHICERCEGASDSMDDWSHVNGTEWWCENCTQSRANWCDYCELWHTGSSYYPEDTSMVYCEDCCDNLYWCEDCDEYYRDGCNACAEENSRVIHDYSYRPDPIFHSTDKDERLFFGIEIEVEAPHNLGDASEYAYRLEPMELAYLKHDGSLNHGFEIVTHPMTHDFYKNEADEFWITLDNLRNNYNVKSWGTRTCGLHIHISRTGFKNPPHMHRFLNLVYSNEELYSTLAGRNSSQWAKFDDIVSAKPALDENGDRYWRNVRSFTDKIQRGRQTDRYSAVNTQNAHTLEMRIFKGSVKTDNVKAQIDLAHASVEYTRNMTVADVRGDGLKQYYFMEYIYANADLYPELCARMSKLIPTTQSAV